MRGDYWIYGLLVVIALVSIVNTGYSYAEPIYLPLIKYYQDTSLFNNDQQILLLSNLPLYAWQGLAYITTSENLELVMFFLFIFTRIFFVFSIYFLGLTLSNNKNIALISTIFSTFIIWTFNIGNFITISSDITPFSLATPFAFFSMAFFFKKDFFKSFLFLAIISYIHPLSTFYLGFIYLIYFIFNTKELNKRIFFGGIISLLIMVPVIIKTISFRVVGDFDFQKWLYFITIRSSHHIFPFSWNLRDYLLFSMLVIFFFISLRSNKNKEKNKSVLYFGFATFLLLIIGTFFSELYSSVGIIKLSLFRSLIFFRVIMFVYVSNYIYHSLKKHRFIIDVSLSLILLLLFSGAILGPAIFGNGFIKNIDFPGSREISSWEDISIKTKEITNKDAIIITSPFEESFKVYSDRNNYFGWIESGSFLYFPICAIEGFDRLNDLCGPFNQKDESFYDIKKMCEDRLRDINKNDLILLKEKYNASYIILKNPTNLELKVLFENEDYTLYKL